ncbi:MAG: calcium/sodium antiporter [Pirellulaceae bacterium]|jgi:cation:H+ antiporter|nr:calcium/sodium antiporter [Pirellulaceae bacterium]
MTTTWILWLFLGGFALLIVGAEVLVRGASRLAVSVGISPLVIGLTVVAYGTSSPEVAVTLQAMFAQPPQPALAVGNVVGSNISNVLLVLGIAALAVPLVVSPAMVRTTVPLLVAVTGLVWYFCLDSVLSVGEGAVLLVGAVLFSVWSVVRSRRATRQQQPEVSGSGPVLRRSAWLAAARNLALVIVGLVLLILGARWLVDGATAVARVLQVSELIIGLTVVAVGTSLPEIATSLVATLRGQRDIAVGNVVGSNIFNLLLVLGMCAAFSPQTVVVPPDALRFDIPIMFVVTAICWPLFYTHWTISRWEGCAFLAAYVAYAVFLCLKEVRHSALDTYVYLAVFVGIPVTVLTAVLLSLQQWYRNRPRAATSVTSDGARD